MCVSSFVPSSFIQQFKAGSKKPESSSERAVIHWHYRVASISMGQLYHGTPPLDMETLLHRRLFVNLMCTTLKKGLISPTVSMMASHTSLCILTLLKSLTGQGVSCLNRSLYSYINPIAQCVQAVSSQKEFVCQQFD